ncbi:MAG: hypothetical protein AB7L13_10960 [Acidimicrobiia bacterium]
MSTDREIDLDHVAVAMEDLRDGYPVYARDLGATYDGGGGGYGFTTGYYRFSTSTMLESMMPINYEQMPFLRQFLDRFGAGPHHFTFACRSIADQIAVLESAGVPLTGISLDRPGVEEAFISPKYGTGIVVQLTFGRDHSHPAPGDYPAPRAGVKRPADFLRVAHAVRDLDKMEHLFADLMHGEVTARGTDHDGRYVDVTWPGGTIRLVTPAAARTPLDEWLGERDARVHHYAMAVEEPAAIANVVVVGDGLYEIAPEHNAGTRIRVSER